MIDLFLFGLFPYIAVAVAVAAGLYRYLVDAYSWSSQSSQFLENRLQFWGSVPWHYAILVILLAHLLAFLLPTAWGALLGSPGRLYFLEMAGMALGLCALVGVVILMARRVGNGRVSAVTTPLDWLLLVALLLQVATGLYIALALRWGSYWYVHSVAPWLWSLVCFEPQIDYMAVLPGVVKLHAVNAFVLVGLFPFTRLVHIVSVPVTYFWRPFQVVIWHRKDLRQ